MRVVLTFTLGFVAVALSACLALGAEMNPGKTFRDCEGCPEMVVVPPGSFMMGTTDAEISVEVEQAQREGYSASRMDREQPVHQVNIDYKLAVSIHEVTRGEFAQFVQESGHTTEEGCYSFAGGERTLRKGSSWKDPGFPQSAAHPVVCVSWNDAKAYALWLGGKTRETYRLLTEAEWEYATRGGTATRYWWGLDSGLTENCGSANSSDLTYALKYPLDIYVNKHCSDGYVHTAPVGRFGTNGFGVYDTIGNVWEWVEDCWVDTYLGASTDGSERRHEECNSRVIRGGAWSSSPRYFRSANRFRSKPIERNDSLGFRLARAIP